MQVRVARYHNIFGPEGTWCNGKEKAPAALCRKVAEAIDGTYIEVWGDGQQTRSFLYIDECIEATRRLMDSNFTGPVNIGSEEMIKINDLAEMVIRIANKNLLVKNISGPVGVRGRNSDNKLYKDKIGWEPSQSLENGIVKTYNWIGQQVMNKNNLSVADLDMRDKFLV
jgi:nucleoside-diphosphate-sugar epimerase